MANGKNGGKRDESISERVARVEQAVESIANDIGQLTRNVDRLSNVVADKFEKAGRTDWRALAAWAAVGVASISVVVGILMPAIVMVGAIGGREIDELKDVDRRREPMIGEFRQLQTQVETSRAHIETQLFSLSARVNVFRDESNRADQILANKVGVFIPPPTYYPPVFGTDKP